MDDITPPQTPPSDTGGFQLPENIASQPYAHKYNSQEAVWKQIENLESLVGKKGYIPPPKEDTEGWSNFKKQISKEVFGVPETPEQYEFENIEGYERPEELTKFARELFHKHDVDVDTANNILKEYEGYLYEQQKQAESKDNEILQQLEADDAKFNEYLTKTYGEKAKEKVLASRELIAKAVPPEVQALVKDLDADALSVLMSTIDSITKQYTGEGSFGKILQNSTTAQSGDDLRAERAKIVANEGFYDFRHPEHQRLKERLQVIEETLYKNK